MNKLTVIGTVILIFGCLITLFSADKVSGLFRAINIGFILGGALVLLRQFKKN